MIPPMRVLTMGAAWRDSHGFNTFSRDRKSYQVLAPRATQVPNIEDDSGYNGRQMRGFETAIRATPSDLVIIGTPIDLRRVARIDRPLSVSGTIWRSSGSYHWQNSRRPGTGKCPLAITKGGRKTI